MSRAHGAAERAAAVLRGDRRAAAQLMRDVEDGRLEAREVLRAVVVARGPASLDAAPWTIGITGPPGAGKSTLIEVLIGCYRARGQRVGVVAVDPSSSLSGGALLGDRVRMQSHATDDGVFIRSIGTRGAMGGLTPVVGELAFVLGALGFSVVLVETVGVGQDEVDVAAQVDTAVVVAVPGLGDGVSALKAGLLELADVLCVNKADRPGADAVTRELQTMLELRTTGSREVPIVATAAATGEGVAGLVEVLERLRHAPELAAQRSARRRAARVAHLRARLRARAEVALERAVGARGGWPQVDQSLGGALATTDDDLDAWLAAAHLRPSA